MFEHLRARYETMFDNSSSVRVARYLDRKDAVKAGNAQPEARPIFATGDSLSCSVEVMHVNIGGNDLARGQPFEAYVAAVLISIGPRGNTQVFMPRRSGDASRGAVSRSRAPRRGTRI